MILNLLLCSFPRLYNDKKDELDKQIENRSILESQSIILISIFPEIIPTYMLYVHKITPVFPKKIDRAHEMLCKKNI